MPGNVWELGMWAKIQSLNKSIRMLDKVKQEDFDFISTSAFAAALADSGDSLQVHVGDPAHVTRPGFAAIGVINSAQVRTRVAVLPGCRPRSLHCPSHERCHAPGALQPHVAGFHECGKEGRLQRLNGPQAVQQALGAKAKEVGQFLARPEAPQIETRLSLFFRKPSAIGLVIG